MPQTVIVNEVNVKGFILSVTTRNAGETREVMEELTFRTVAAWLAIADALENGSADKFAAFGSVEERYADEINKAAVDTDGPKPEPFSFGDSWGDPRCTVWDTFRSSKPIHFHLNSDDKIPVAIATWQANQNAIKRIAELYHQKPAPELPQEPPQSAPQAAGADRPATPKNAPDAQNSAPAPHTAVEGAIVATRAPNSNRPDYANGQLVSFTVTKIVASSNKGSAVYQMWTPLGTQYPTLSIYKLKPDGNLKPDYEAIVPVLNTLNLSLDKPEAVGTWRLVCKAAHVPNKDGADREFLNVVSLTAI